MLPFGLNHITMARSSTIELLDMAKSLSFAGVELRNDLKTELFDGKDPVAIREAAGARALRIFVLAEVYAFNDNSENSRSEAYNLIQLACACGAEAIALIPRVATSVVDRQTQRAILRNALDAIKPMLDDTGVVALIEPLGFANSSLRFKADAIAVLDEMGQPDCFALIHDTFHHAISGETQFFADATRIIHISGVTDPSVAPSEMVDADRGLVDGNDRLGNAAQVQKLRSQGFAGPLSFEAFAPNIHELIDPTDALSASSAFMTSHVAELAA